LSQIAVLFLTKTDYYRLIIHKKILAAFKQNIKSRTFKNFFLEICRIPQNLFPILFKRFLYKFNPCKLNVEWVEIMISSPSVFKNVFRKTRNFLVENEYKLILFVFLRYSVGCRSPPLVLHF